MKTLKGISYGPHPENLFDAYLPDQEGFEIVVWFHGGGFESGSRDRATIFVEDFVKEGYGVFSVDYRMYPNAKYPDFIEDGAAAVAFIKEHVAEYGGNGTLYVSGRSAGAYLIMMLCLAPEYLNRVGLQPQDISGFIADSAQQTVHFNVLRERGLDTRLERIDEAAPLFHLHENTIFSKLLLLYYTQDIPCRKEQNLLAYMSLKRLLPNAIVEKVELEGGHCHGSSERNEKGTFDFVDCVLQFIKK